MVPRSTKSFTTEREWSKNWNALNMMTFQWLFEAVSNRRTRITQRIVLSGDNAMAYVKQVQAGFELHLSDGMKRIAHAMAEAERSEERHS